MKKITTYILFAAVVVVIGIVVSMYYLFGFGGKDECWDEGEKMAIGKPSTITIPENEAKRLFGEDIDISSSGTAEVGTAAYYHFKCHFDEQ